MKRDYYTLLTDERFCIEEQQFWDLIHLAATGKFAIHALVSNMLIQPYTINDDGTKCLLNRIRHTGLVQFQTEDVLRFEANPKDVDVSLVELSPFDGTHYALPFRWFNYGEEGFGTDVSKAEPDSFWMHFAHMVITAEEWEKAALYLEPEKEEQPSNGPSCENEKPLSTRERRTLLTIIAALCKKAKIDPKRRGAAQDIMALTEELGAKVSDDTIKGYLDEIPDAVESRMK